MHIQIHVSMRFVKSFLASGDFCHLLITFANSLNTDQDCRSFSGYKPFDILIVFLNIFFEKLILKK